MRLAKAVLVCVALAGCVEAPPVWYREGATGAAVSRARLDCDVLAVNRVPTNTQISTIPAVVSPTYTSCRPGYGGNVSCTTTGGQVYGGGVTSYDANAGLRHQVVAQCMESKGWQKITLPYCTDAVSFSYWRRVKADPGYFSRQQTPKITASTCVAPLQDGSLQIVNPA